MSEVVSVLSYIKSSYNSLTKSEKKVADFILASPKEVVYMPISEVSSNSSVGDTTVLRFCKKLGFNTYQDFKLSLVQDLTSKELDNSIDSIDDFKISKEDSLDELAKKVIGYDMAILEETLELLNYEELAKAKDAVIKANRIALFGVGASAITGLDVALKFMRIGFNVSCHTELHAQMMYAALLNEDDLAIGISFSGSSKDTNRVLEIAKEAGAKILCITHHANSPITKISDITLLHGAKEDPLQGGNFSSKIAQMSIVDILYHAVYREVSEKISKYNAKTSKAITDTMM